MIRSCLKVYLGVNKRIWRRLPKSLRNRSVGWAYGRHLYGLVRRYSRRDQNHSTFFLRNRPEMELMCRLLEQEAPGAKVAISVLACSKGAEVYSILWSIRRSRPDLKISLQAVDISHEIIDFAKRGVFSRKGPVSLKAPDRLGMTEEERLT